MTPETASLEPPVAFHAGERAAARPKILLTSLSGQLGGLELRLAEEARLLDSLGYASALAISPFPGSDAWMASLRREGLTIADYSPPPFFEEWRWRRANLWRARLLWAPRLRRAAPRLVHVAYAWTQTGGSRLWLNHCCNIPSVISVHNFFPLARMSPWHERLTSQAFRSVKGIYGVSASALERFCDIYSPFIGKETVRRAIHNFVDVDRFFPSAERRAATRAALGIPGDALVVGSIGRLDEQKEPLSLIRIFDVIAQRHLNAYLVFVGQGPLAKNARAECDRHGWAGRVRFTGFRDDVERLYPALDVHVLLSQREGFGISTVEAMACGVAVLATDVPGTRDVMHGSQAGVLVPYSAHEAAVAELEALLLEPTRRATLGAAGRAHAMARFSKERWSDEVSQFYEDVLA